MPVCRTLVTENDVDGGEVRWFGPGQPDEAVRHVEWCRAVGPLVVGGPGSHEVHRVDSLAVLSYNMNLGAGSVIDLVDSLRNGVFTSGSPVGDFVLLLQETFRDGHLVPDPAPRGSKTGRARYPASDRGMRLDVRRIADSLQLYLYYAPAMRGGRARNPNGLPEDRGSAILATLPLTDLTLVELPLAGQRRVGQLARLNGVSRSGTPWSIQVANVHFSIGPFGPSAVSAIRARQARAMVAAADSTGAVVLGGDLNAFSVFGTAESVRILRAAFPGPGSADDAPTRGWQRLDYLFFRLPGTYRSAPYVRLPQTFGSDHHPIMGWVYFPSTARGSALRVSGPAGFLMGGVAGPRGNGTE